MQPGEEVTNWSVLMANFFVPIMLETSIVFRRNVEGIDDAFQLRSPVEAIQIDTSFFTVVYGVERVNYYANLALLHLHSSGERNAVLMRIGRFNAVRKVAAYSPFHHFFKIMSILS